MGLVPTLKDWLALEPTEETALMVRLFELRPDWLPTGKLEGEVLVWFDSNIENRPLYLDYEEFTVGWNTAHYHLLHSVEDPVVTAIEMIEDVLEGRRLRIYTEDGSGRWQGAGLCTAEEIPPLRAEYESRGWNVSVQRFPGIELPSGGSQSRV